MIGEPTQAPSSSPDAQASPRPLRVLFNDPCHDTNPYHLLLARALRDHNVHILGSPPSTLILRHLRAAQRAGGRVDAVHVHWLHQPMMDPGLCRAATKSALFIIQLALIRLSGRGLIWTAHNLKSHDTPHPRLDRLATRAVARLCHRIIAHCDAARDELFAHLGSAAAPAKVRVVPHGSYEDFYPPVASASDARAQLGLDPAHRVLVFLGNIRPYKGVLELIKAFRSIADPRLRLIIAGRAWDASVDRTVRDAIGDDARIIYAPGFVPAERVPLYMAAADVAVFPYRDILTSGAVLLAMTFGLPCVAVRRGCIRETLDARGGFLYDADTDHDNTGHPDNGHNDNGLALALRAAVETPDVTLRAMGEHNARIAASLGWRTTLAGRTRAVYDEAVGGR